MTRSETCYCGRLRFQAGIFLSGVDSQIRRDWLFAVTRDCQVFLGSAGALDRTTFSTRVREFAQSIASPSTRSETLLLRGLLLDLALQWGELDHRLFHAERNKRLCRFLPGRVVQQTWTHASVPAADVFTEWGKQYQDEFSVAHPNAVVDLIRRRIDSDFASKMRLGELASQYRCAAATLARQFRRTMGCSIHDYQARVRVGQMVELLQRTMLSVEEIARRVGYASKKDVYRVLRRAGYPTPSELRQCPRRRQRDVGQNSTRR